MYQVDPPHLHGPPVVPHGDGKTPAIGCESRAGTLARHRTEPGFLPSCRFDQRQTGLVPCKGSHRQQPAIGRESRDPSVDGRNLLALSFRTGPDLAIRQTAEPEQPAFLLVLVLDLLQGGGQPASSRQGQHLLLVVWFPGWHFFLAAPVPAARRPLAAPSQQKFSIPCRWRSAGQQSAGRWLPQAKPSRRLQGRKPIVPGQESQSRRLVLAHEAQGLLAAVGPTDADRGILAGHSQQPAVRGPGQGRHPAGWTRNRPSRLLSVQRPKVGQQRGQGGELALRQGKMLDEPARLDLPDVHASYRGCRQQSAGR